MSKVFISLFDMTGYMAQPWAEAGYTCYCIDILNTGKIKQVGAGSISFLNLDLLKPENLDFLASLDPVFIAGFPPCTDLAVSGARHFAAKRRNNPKFQEDAANLARVPEALANKVGCPWFVENPVSVLASLWRKPDYSFQPSNYGAYLPEDDKHPEYPKYIAPRDAYLKTTCIWAGNGFKMPPYKFVIPEKGWNRQTRLLGGKSLRTKIIRSATPRGFARAVFLANAEKQDE